MSRKAFFWAGLLVALFLAGVVSYWASNAPDGLNRVAIDHGLDTHQRDSATAGSPLANYEASGIDDARLSGAVAGILGVGLTLVLAGGVFYALARRSSPGEDLAPTEPSEPASPRR